MKIWNGLESYSGDGARVVASIGNYDGVHRGHRAILEAVTQHARRERLDSLLISFDPHPLTVVNPARLPQMLQTRRQKLTSLEETGLSVLLFVEFTPELADLSGEEFFETQLAGRLDFEAIYVGTQFRFGKGRSGDSELLAQIGARQGFSVYPVPPVLEQQQIISSSAIRTAVEQGEVERARVMLGRPYELAGEVRPGNARGRTLDCPTANVDVENECLPRQGVYITETLALAGRFPSVTNLGVRPTFGGETVCVETHLLDFDEDLYGERIAVRFLARLRDEMRFNNATQLADQIARDRAAAESYFQNLPIGAP